jgi:chromosome segregation ATPase
MRAFGLYTISMKLTVKLPLPQLQRFRQLVAQKSAERLSNASNDNVIERRNETIKDKEYEESASDLTNELKAAAKVSSTSLSIFKDSPFAQDQNENDAGRGNGDNSIKSRMKHSLAQRRTALQSRNVNVQEDDINGQGKKSTLKKRQSQKSLLASAKQMSSSQQQKVQSPMMKSELKSTVFASADADEVEEKSAAEDNEPSLGDFSLDLDDTAESEAVDSMHSGSMSHAADDNTDNSTKDFVEENEEQIKKAEEEMDSFHSQLSKYIDAIKFPQLETLAEEKEDVTEKEIENSAEIEKENGELLSIVESCESVKSKSSSVLEQELMNDEQLSPKSACVSDASSLTPGGSVQTLSIGSTGLSSEKSNVQSQNSGGTQMGSIQTVSIGGRPVNISTDPFETSIFTPSAVHAEDLLTMEDNESQEEDSPSGQTVIPNVSIHDSEYFPSPNRFMLYASPAGKGDLDNLSRQLEEIRSEQEESGRKMALSTSHAKKLLKIYDDVHNEVESEELAPMNASHGASPVSKALATGDSWGLSKTAAASLIERNKTLVKEVRFADQTCVELSERNSAMAREIVKMEKDEEELKSKNDSLHNAVVRASEASARAQEISKKMEARLEEQKKHFDQKLQAVNENLQEEKDKSKKLSEELIESNATASRLDNVVATTTANFEAMNDEYREAKETITSLRQRLMTVESTAELASSAAAQKYREASFRMQKELEDLQDDYEMCVSELDEEKLARQSAEEELSELRELCEELELARKQSVLTTSPHATKESMTSAKVTSPISTASQDTRKTTASTVLAKTLKLELERAHDATERIIESERIISVTQSKLRETEKELKCAKIEISTLRKKVHNQGDAYTIRNSDQQEKSDDSSIETKKSKTKDVSQKLSAVRLECNEYKKELDSIITQIQGIDYDDKSMCQPSPLSEDNPNSTSLLKTVQDLAQVCGKVNVAAGERVGELEGRIQFLTQSMNQLNEICGEDLSDTSDVSMSLQIMEEGVSTPARSSKTPMKFLFMGDTDNNPSPVGSNSLLEPPREITPVKIVGLRSELSAALEQIQTLTHEKDTLLSAIVEAREQIELLSLSAQDATVLASGNKTLLDEKAKLESSVFDLRHQIKQFESRIESLEDDKAYLFDDAAARVDELEQAKGRNDELETKLIEKSDLLKKIQDEHVDATNTHRKEVDNLKHMNNELEIQLSTLKNEAKSMSADAEIKVAALRKELQMLTAENDGNVDMIHELQESLAESIEQGNELKAAFINCNEELAQNLEENEELKSTNHQLETRIQSHHNELNRKCAELESTLKEYQQVKTRLSEAENAYDSLHEELLKVGTSVEVLTEANDEYAHELKRCAEDKIKMKMEVDACKEKITLLTEDLQGTKESLTNSEVGHANTKLYLEKAEQKFIESKAAMMETNDILRTELMSKNDEVSVLKTRFDEMEMKIIACEKRETEMNKEHQIEMNHLKEQQSLSRQNL